MSGKAPLAAASQRSCLGATSDGVTPDPEGVAVDPTGVAELVGCRWQLAASPSVAASQTATRKRVRPSKQGHESPG